MPVTIFGRDKTDDLIRLARDVIKFDVNVLCEGDDDTKVLKALIDKLGMEITKGVRVNDSGGTPRLEELASMVATLVRLKRRLKKIVLIVDADRFKPQDRAESLRQSLNSHEVEVGQLEEVSGSIYRAESVGLDFLFKVVGNMELPFKRHEMEDYAVDLLLMRNLVTQSNLKGYHKSSDFIEDYGKKADTIIHESQADHIKQAYRNVIELVTRM